VLISNAYAQGAGGGAGDPTTTIIMIGGMFVIMYFMMIRPQMKRQKEQKAMVDALQKGDEVITSGGILGKVTKVSDAYLTVEVAESGDKPVEMRIQKVAVQTLLPKGTIKSI
jgi:preprotein translocase subunit YajC